MTQLPVAVFWKFAVEHGVYKVLKRNTIQTCLFQVVCFITCILQKILLSVVAALRCDGIGNAVLPKWADGKACESRRDFFQFGDSLGCSVYSRSRVFRKYLEVEQILSDPSKLRRLFLVARSPVPVSDNAPP